MDRDALVRMVQKALQDSLDLKEILVKKEQLVEQAVVDDQGGKAKKVLKVWLGLLAVRELRAAKVDRVPQVVVENLEMKVLTVRQVLLDLLDPQDQQVELVNWVSMV